MPMPESHDTMKWCGSCSAVKTTPFYIRTDGKKVLCNACQRFTTSTHRVWAFKEDKKLPLAEEWVVSTDGVLVYRNSVSK